MDGVWEWGIRWRRKMNVKKGWRWKWVEKKCEQIETVEKSTRNESEMNGKGQMDHFVQRLFLDTMNEDWNSVWNEKKIYKATWENFSFENCGLRTRKKIKH